MTAQASAKGVPVVAVDTGGTFTDLLLLRDGRLRTLKVPSTPADPAEAVLAGIRELTEEGEAFLLLHGSTVATNALLERKGARVVLVTNAGFEDVIEIGRQNRPQLYALVGHRPPPLVDRADRVGILGRLGPGGEELEPLDEGELATLPERVGRGEAVAVCLLHSYADPAHERAVARALEGLGAPLSVSSDL
ncbi:MAG TPA: hydantoinase/oxoprolinase N-terminal domain-containing protein, partial [Longimicrobiales bacterium]|nr:hydantoinase/oxoprolinase N-terminal domain-containing protein [Longimicrobiales bacterium]